MKIRHTNKADNNVEKDCRMPQQKYDVKGKNI